MSSGDPKWVTVKVQLPDTIQSVVTALDSILDAILAVLDIVSAILDLIKAFAIGLLDPLALIINEILSEIESFLADLRSIGVYMSGDIEMSYPYADLLGGYAAYERRVIQRFTNRQDPTRPNFSPNSEVVAAFFYTSGDATQIEAMVLFLERIKSLFGVRNKHTRSNTVPVGLTVKYGTSSTVVGLFDTLENVFSTGSAPSVANIQWTMAPPAGGKTAFPLPAPAGFLVEVSTIQDGFSLTYETAAQGSSDTSPQAQVQGLIFDPEGKNFKLYGGLDVLSLDSGLDWLQLGDTWTPKSVDSTGKQIGGGTKVYLHQSNSDSVAIPPTALRQTDGEGKSISVFQRAFFLDMNTVLGVNPVAPGQPYSIQLKQEDMPYGATITKGDGGAVTVTVDDEPARTVYVRVSALTKNVVLGTDTACSYYYSASETIITSGISQNNVVLSVPSASVGDKGDTSSPVKIEFPAQSVADYIDLVATALAVMVLSRADLSINTDISQWLPQSAFTATGLEDIASYLTPQVVGHNPAKYWQRKQDAHKFRTSLRQRCRAVASELVLRMGSLDSSLQDYIVSKAVVVLPNGGGTFSLQDLTWQQMSRTYGPELTILDSLGLDSDESVGVAANPLSTKITVAVMSEQMSLGKVTLEHNPAFVDTGGIQTTGSDMSPVLFDVRSAPYRMEFIRNIFLANPEILSVSAFVLQVASASMSIQPGSANGSWISYKLIPQGMPPVEQFLEQIASFLHSLELGISGVTDLIVQYIDFVQARIQEMEAMIRRIESLLEFVTSIDVPSASALIVTGQGTDGVLGQFITAENKPSDNGMLQTLPNGTLTGTYGAGVVFVTGGLPTAVLDIFKLFFPPTTG